jgi:hypothetical protein
MPRHKCMFLNDLEMNIQVNCPILNIFCTHLNMLEMYYVVAHLTNSMAQQDGDSGKKNLVH